MKSLAILMLLLFLCSGSAADGAAFIRESAEKGIADAQYKLGGMYDVGKGVPQDDAQAAIWYRKAADQGHAAAQCALGLQCSQGKGVPNDAKLAYMWLCLASARDKQYSERRDAEASRLTPNQLAEAQKMAREWLPTKTK